MKRKAKILAVLCTAALMTGVCAFSACIIGERSVYVTSIEATSSDGSGQTYTVYYSDGTASEFTVKNGTDGSDGAAGAAGRDGSDLTVEDIYAKYVEEYGEISYADFLSLYLSVNTDNSAVIAECMLSSVKVYSEFVEGTYIQTGLAGYRKTYDTALYTGAGIIWRIDGDYTYIVTNYHVVFDSSADETKNGGSQIARTITCYLYGSEYTPYTTDSKDADGYSVIEYGDYAVECEYVGGSINCDLAVLRAETDDLKALNGDIKQVTVADEYYVGQTAIAIGNPENGGISVTEGIVSVDNEYIKLSLDGTARYYRSIRIDTALYSGNSGGGLFNADGKLIGITNAGASDDENINYAIPLQIVKGAVGNILYYYGDEDASTVGAYKITLGVTVLSQNSRYVYDSAKGCGKIVEDVVLGEVASGSIADLMGLAAGDYVTAVTVDGSEYPCLRSFDISDAILTMRSGSSISVAYTRGGQECISAEYTVKSSDLVSI